MQKPWFPTILCLMLLAGVSACVKPMDVDTCYTPASKCSNTIISEIGTARTEVLVQAHALTSKPVMDALARAYETGAKISVILDQSSPSVKSSSLYLASKRGVFIFIDGRHAVAGSNVMIIDGSMVITGSMIFSDAADAKSAENMVVIRSNEVAESYRTNWQEHREHAEEFVKIVGPQKKDDAAPAPAKKKAAKGKKKVS